MAIQLVRENFEVESISGEGQVQALIEGSVILPAPARDAVPLYTDARIEIGNTEVQTDRVAMDGQVFFTVVYATGEEGGVHSVETALNFSHILEVPDAGPKMGIDVQGIIEHAESEITGGKATMRAIAKLRARTSTKQNIACISEIEEVDQLQILSNHPQSLRTLGRGEVRAMLDDQFELPFGLESEEALFGHAKATIDRVVAMEDRVEITGQVTIDAYHRTTMFDRPIARTKHTLPFATGIDIAGCRPSLPTNAKVEVRELSLDLRSNEEEKTLVASMLLITNVCVQERFEIQAIEDAYTASDELLTLKTSTITARTDLREEHGVDSMKTVLSLDVGHPPMGVVLAAFARPAMWETTTDTRTHVEGVLEVTVLYYPQGSDKPASLQEEVPFRVTYDFALPEDAWSTFWVEDTEAIQITGDRMEFKCNLHMNALAYETSDFTVALDAEMSEDAQELPGGVTLYFVQPGDTLWSVAKRFRTTKDSVTHFNPEITELTGKERILLYKRKTIV